jgi:hypothetical protein
MLTVRRAVDGDIPVILEVINDAARAYKGIIPSDTYKEPYMPEEELRSVALTPPPLSPPSLI